VGLNTEADICNLALARIGQTAEITDLNDTSAAGLQCKRLYPHCRDLLLQRAWWPFATRRATLTLLSDVERSGWEYVYSLPSDCIAVQEIWNGQRRSLPKNREPFKVEHHSTGKVLLTDAAEPEVLYTARVTEPVRFSPSFADALAWHLALELTVALSDARAHRQMVRQEADLAWRSAVAADFSEGQMDPPPKSELITGRG